MAISYTLFFAQDDIAIRGFDEVDKIASGSSVRHWSLGWEYYDKNLPTIPSPNFYSLFLFYSHNTTIIPFLFYCVNDNIRMQECYYIYLHSLLYLLTALY